MALQKSDFDVYTVRPKKAVRNAEGLRVVEEFSDQEWADAKANADAIIANQGKERKNAIRRERSALLSQTDYAVLPDSTLSSDDLAKLKTWRQQLRDLPSTKSDDKADEITIPNCPVASLGITVVQIPVEGSA